MENVSSFEFLESIGDNNKIQIWKNKEDYFCQAVFYWENNSDTGSNSNPTSGCLVEIFSPNESKEITFPECTFSGLTLVIKLDLKEASIDELGRITFNNKNIQLSSKVMNGILENKLISGTELACLTTGCNTCKAVG